MEAFKILQCLHQVVHHWLNFWPINYLSQEIFKMLCKSLYKEKLIISKLYVTVCTKTDLVRILFYYCSLTDALNNYPSPVYQIIQMLNVNWSAFLEGICWYSKIITGTMAPMKDANYIGGEDLRLLAMPMWSTNVAWAILGILAALEVFFASHSTHHWSPPMWAMLTLKRTRQKHYEIHTLVS